MSETETKVPQISLSGDVPRTFWNMMGVPVPQIIAAMERCETWTVDNEDNVEILLRILDSKLSEATPEQVVAMVHQAPGSVIDMSAYLKSSRAILLLRWLSDVNPNIIPVLVQYASESGSECSLLMIERMQSLEKVRVLSRLFSPDRLSTILETLEVIAVNA